MTAPSGAVFVCRQDYEQPLPLRTGRRPRSLLSAQLVEDLLQGNVPVEVVAPMASHTLQALALDQPFKPPDEPRALFRPGAERIGQTDAACQPQSDELTCVFLFLDFRDSECSRVLSELSHARSPVQSRTHYRRGNRGRGKLWRKNFAGKIKTNINQYVM